MKIGKLPLAMASIFFGACANSSQSPTDTLAETIDSSGSGDIGGSRESATDSGAPSDSSIDARLDIDSIAESSDGSSATSEGIVELVWTEADVGAFYINSGLSAFFAETTGQLQRTVGSCVVRKDLMPDGGPSLTITSYLNAGTINATNGILNYVISPQTDNTYSIYGIAEPNVGETYDFSASGGDIPAFNVTLTAPAPVTFTNPSSVIDDTEDLVVNWTGGAAGGFVEVKIAQNKPNYGVAVECSFDSAAGTGTIPAGAMTDLVPVTDVSSSAAYFYYTSGVEQAISPGGFPVTVKVQYLSYGKDGGFTVQ